jgi:hypothetical protein
VERVNCNHKAAVHKCVTKLESSAIPLLASPQGGVAERLKNIAKHPLNARPGWFSDKNKKENHPGCVASVASRYFFDDTATPPCGDARRGLTLYSNLFTPSRRMPSAIFFDGTAVPPLTGSR